MIGIIKKINYIIDKINYSIDFIDIKVYIYNCRRERAP